MSINNPVILGIFTAVICSGLVAFASMFTDSFILQDPIRTAVGGFAAGIVAGLVRNAMRRPS